MPERAKILPTGDPNHNVSLIFQFSSLVKKAPVLQFQLFRELFKENRTKNHKAFKNTKQAGGAGPFSVPELTRGRLQEMLVALPAAWCRSSSAAAVSQQGARKAAPHLFPRLYFPRTSAERNLRSSGNSVPSRLGFPTAPGKCCSTGTVAALYLGDRCLQTPARG